MIERLRNWVAARGAVLLPLGLALVAGAIAWGTLRSRAAAVQAGWELEEVVVAAAGLAAGQIVEAAHLARREVPARFVTTSVVRPDQIHLVEGQRLEAPLQPGDPVLWTHFSIGEAARGLAQVVHPPGRAVTLQVGEAASVGGQVRPNDHVDVVSTFRDPASHEMATVTLLQNVLVLSTGGEGGGPTGHVTVLVLPEEAELLVLAQELGSLSLSLRHPEDLEVRSERARTTVQTLLTGERNAELQRRRHAIQVIRGNPGISRHEGFGP
ncbi:Flp pilus assembly protein CpaB [Vulgatibacter sp.]|uniref:Flp pilus assembly protein CpaB n=1 Tax=Vulgatibacter sp. TaxID=1971226 RepID=UPI003565FA2A